MTEKQFPESLQDREAAASIERGLRQVMERVAEAETRRGNHEKITVVAATKTVPAERILYAASLGLGLTDVGENRVQELLDKYDEVSRCLRVHMIGRLQTNKVKYLVGKTALIHSVDSLRLCDEIERRAAACGLIQDILIEVNIGREADKGGVLPESVGDLLDRAEEYPHVRMAGIMTVAPHCECRDAYRPYFEETAKIYQEIYLKKIRTEGPTYLSMGMSDNYDLALEYGANIIRPGSAIFGRR